MTVDNHRAKAFYISVVAYVVFLSLLFFATISYTPEPEFLTMGVDLNYGVDLKGYGDNQTLNKANASPVTEEMAPSGDENTEPESSPTPPTPAKPQPKAVTPVTTKSVAKKVITSDVEKTVVRSPRETSKNPPSSTAKETAKPAPPSPPAPQRSVDESSIFKKRGSASNSNGTVGTKSGIGGNNNGDGSPGDVGDQGSTKGTLDGKSLYGKPGNGGTSGGASVSISGWQKKNFNLPKDKSNETGKIVFQVTVNDLGTLTQIRATSSTVSPSVTKFYEDYFKRNLSSFLIPQGTPPPNSSGQITIIIKSD